MGKTIGLKQLAQKNYILIEGLSQELKKSIGHLEDAFDACIFGASGNGKSNLTAKIIIDLVKALNCKCHYVAYEEGHAFTIQETMISRHNMLEEIGNALQITDHLTFDELQVKMARKQSAKIWVIDSLQSSRFSVKECTQLKQRFVLSKKRKIIIYISWAEGKAPQGAVAKAVEYLANIKMRVEGFIMFPKSRYGGNQPFVIWEGDKTQGARKYWGKDFEKKAGIVKGTAPKKETTLAAEKITNLQIASQEVKPVFKEPLKEIV